MSGKLSIIVIENTGIDHFLGRGPLGEGVKTDNYNDGYHLSRVSQMRTGLRVS